MAKYVKATQEKLNEAINGRIKERLTESSEVAGTYVREEQINKSNKSNEEVERTQKDDTKKGTSKVKQALVRLPWEMYEDVVVSALAGHDNNFTQYIKDLIMEDYERNKEYYKACIELKKKFKNENK